LDIAEAATVNRATFYDHYNDKFALFEAMIAGGFHSLLDQRKIEFDQGCLAALRAIVQATCDYLVQTHEGHDSCGRNSAFQPIMDAAITRAIQRTLLEGTAKKRASALSPEIVAGAASWAIYGAAREWFNTPSRAPVEQAVPAIADLVAPMLPH